MKKYEEIGKRLESLRGNENQQVIADKIGVSLRSYQRFEYGERLPKGDVLQRIAELYGETADYILTGKRPVTALDVASRLLVPEETRKAWGEIGAIVKNAVREIEAERIAEQHGIYNDDLTLKILDVLKDMDIDQKRDALRFIEGQKLLAEREKKINGGIK